MGLVMAMSWCPTNFCTSNREFLDFTAHDKN